MASALSRLAGATRSCRRFEFERDFRADDIGPGGEELAELDVGRAEAVDRPRKAHRVAPGDQIGRAEAEAGERRQVVGVEAGEGPLARQDKTGAREPQGVADRRQGQG